MLETAAFAWIKVLAQRAVEKTLCVIISERLYVFNAKSAPRGFYVNPFFAAFDRLAEMIQRVARRPIEGIHWAATRYIPCDPRLKESHPFAPRSLA